MKTDDVVLMGEFGKHVIITSDQILIHDVFLFLIIQEISENVVSVKMRTILMTQQWSYYLIRDADYKQDFVS